MKEITITKREEGQRFDRFLGKYLPGASSGFLHKMLRKKNIKLNGKKAEGREKLSAGDLIQIFFSDETFEKFQKPQEGGKQDTFTDGKSIVQRTQGKQLERTKQKKRLTKEEMNLREQVKVLYSSEDILVFHKPAGMLSQRAKADDDSLNDYLIDYCVKNGIISREELAAFRPSVANRLDRNTSGIVLAGISIRGLQTLSIMLRERTLGKYYLCLVERRVKEDARISGYLTKEEKNKERKKLGKMILKAVGIVLLATIVTLGSVLIYANVKHRKALKEEEKYMTPPGQMVEIDGHEIHVVHRGDETAKHALVFIHSNKTADDSIALEPLFDELSDYELIYVDRSGSGYSDDWDAPKDIDSMLAETRAAVKTVTGRTSYILVASKSGGTLAVDWADEYPDEVEAIVGLQMYFPDQYEGMDEDAYCSFENKIMLELVKIGGQRLSDSVLPDNSYNIYTKDQMDRRNAIIEKGLYTQGMYNEDKNLVKNANKVAALGFPQNTPMYMIYCNPFTDPFLHQDDDTLETYEDLVQNSEEDPAGTYNSYYKEYAESHSNVEMTEMSGPDRLIVYNPQKEADLIKEYIGSRVK